VDVVGFEREEIRSGAVARTAPIRRQASTVFLVGLAEM
jgi:hypothetical protein